MRRIAAFLTIFAILAAPSAAEITVHLDTPASDIQLQRSGDYLIVALADGVSRAAPGAPDLPLRSLPVVLPLGAVVTGVTVAGEERVLAGDAMLQPYQPSRASGSEPPPLVPPDAASYADAAILPQRRAVIGSECRIRGHRIAQLRLAPLRYLPAERRLLHSPRLTVTISYQQDLMLESVEPAAPTHPSIDRLLRQQVANPVDLAGPAGLQMEALATEETIDYLIVTSVALADAFQDLADYRATRDGYRTRVVTVESIDEDYSGVDQQARIRACITDYIQNHQTLMVVLGGDDKAVPPRLCYGEVPAGLPNKFPNLPADLYFADIDGHWNANGNDLWGELDDDVDFGYDVVLGRIPVETAQHVATYLTKLQAAENDPPFDLRERFLMGGSRLGMGGVLEPEDPGLPGDEDLPAWDGLAPMHETGRLRNDDETWTRRLIKQFLADEGYSPDLRRGLFSTVTSWDDAVPGDYDITPDHMVDRLNESWGLVFWFAHGDIRYIYTEAKGSNGLKGYDIETYLPQTTGIFPLLVAPTCSMGYFDRSISPCLAEEIFWREGAGMVVYHGASRYGYGGGSDPVGGESPRYGASFLRQMVRDPALNVGEAFVASKAEYIDQCDSYGYWRTLMFSINLLGDPGFHWGGESVGLPEDFFTSWRDHDELIGALRDLAAGNPRLREEVIGTSIEGRDIVAFHLDAADPATAERLMLVGLQHGDEWEGGMASAYVLDQFLNNPDEDPAIAAVADQIDLTIVPIANPDGYAYSWTDGNRIWRRNRRDNGDGTFGVDLNRNWSFNWVADSNTGFETYPGPSAFSEPESRALRDLVSSLPDLAMAVDIHSPFGAVLQAYASTDEAPERVDELTALTDAMVAAMNPVDPGRSYYGNNGGFGGSGPAIDWWLAEAGSLAWAFELLKARNDDQILLRCRESLAGALVLAGALAEPGGGTPPSITAGPTATPDPVTGTSCALTVTATDDGPTGELGYSWSASGPTGVAFTPTDSATPTATFAAVGNYTITVTVTDGDGLSTNADLVLTVTPTPSVIELSP